MRLEDAQHQQTEPKTAPIRPVTPEPPPQKHNDFLSLMDFLQTKVQVPPRVIARSPFPHLSTPAAPLPQYMQPHWVAQHIFDEAGKKLSLDDLLTGPYATIWKR